MGVPSTSNARFTRERVPISSPPKTRYVPGERAVRYEDVIQGPGRAIRDTRGSSMFPFQ